MNVDQTLVTYLEMSEAPCGPEVQAPRADVRIQLCEGIDPQLYLRLQREVGSKYYWVERTNMDEETLVQQIHHPSVDVFLIYCGEQVSGFCELDRRQPPNVEIKFFGLLPQFIGQGLGRYFLDQMIRRAWVHKPDKLWLHTDSNDHPRALANYQKAGFVIFKQSLEKVRLA